MKANLFFVILILLLLQQRSFSQQLVINEVSQGPSGSKEYVELLVVGTITCNAIPCMDLRNYIIDDNNGNHALGAGTGIASGCVRLKNIAFWSCIPIGTMILIYNDADQNILVPPIDLSMMDGNCRLIIPVSDCTLLERHTTQPSTGNAVYPSVGFTNCGSWTEISMANGDDSFQTINPAGGLVHSVSWGNNVLSTVIYFAGSAGGRVALMTNSTDNNPANQANWILPTVAGNESPGLPNSPANNAWISSMTNSCTPLSPFSISVTASPAGCVCNGSATVTASGAVAPYTYTWFPVGGNSNVATGLCAGIYTLSSTSANGCMQTATVNITSVSSLSASVSSTSITCNGLSNGSATVTVSGGNPGYTYSWVPSGGTSSVATGLGAGSYTVIVTDNLGCTVTAVANIIQPSILTAGISSSNISCNGGLNGSATVTASGGTPGYTYSWIPTGGTSSVSSGLGAGSYTVIVTDNNGCTVTAVANITQPSVLTASVNTTNASCGMLNGSATVTAGGGTPIYTYSWLPVGGTSSVASGLGAGSYTVIITDNNGCNISLTAIINQPGSMTTTITTINVACNGQSTGAATLMVAGGAGPYSYTWSPAPGGGQGTGTVSGLTAQTYTVLISDVFGCSVTTTVSITQPPALSAVISSTNVTCNGATNGIANVTAGGGTPLYNYNWLPSGGTSSIAAGLPAGTHTVFVTDNNGCTITAVANITEPSVITAIISATNISCNGFTNGAASVIAGGGTPGYNYTWTPSGIIGSTINNLSAGSYSVIVKDAANCTVIAVTSITQPAQALSAITSATNVLCFGNLTGKAAVTAIGGTAPYTYSWSPSAGTGSLLSNLAQGNYTAWVTDFRNCTFSVTAGITQPQALTVSVTGFKLCNGQTGTLTGMASGGVSPYSYFWNNVPGNNTISGNQLTSGTYSFYVTDGNGCNSLTDTAFVIIGGPLSLSVSPSLTICAGKASVLSASAIGGVGNYQYSWIPGNFNGPSVSVTINNTTIFTVTASDGCTLPNAVQTITVYTEPVGTPTLLANMYKGCSPLCATFTNTSLLNNNLIQSCFWNFGDSTNSSLISPTHCFNEPGIYKVSNVFSTVHGCVRSATLTSLVEVYQKPTAAFIADQYTVGIFNPLANFYNQSVNAGNYLWDFSSQAQSTQVNTFHNFPDPGKYLVTLVAYNGLCSDTAFKLIECLPEFTFYAPNTFSPNDDNINDRFLPKGEGWKTESYSLSVFDRWGEQIFYTKQFDEGWNGKQKGTEVKNDIYVWKVLLKDIFDKQHEFAGTVSVIK